MNFEFVIATPLSEKEYKESKTSNYNTLSYFCGPDSKHRYKVNIIFNNKQGLSDIYNHFLIEENRDKHIIFVHDDVLLEDAFMFEKLEDAHKTYDIVGLAGNKNCVVKSPALWHLMSYTEGNRWNNQGDLRGFVSHIFPDGKSNMSYFGNSPDSVKLLDGLFLSVSVSSTLDRGVKFDEDFDFHFYDLAFSIRAINAGLKLGVCPIFVRHYGLGHTDKNWKDLEPLFITKYE